MNSPIKTVLVTGSEGSIGKFIVKYLYEKDKNIRVIRTGRIEHKLTDNKSKYYWGNLSDIDFCKKIMTENNIDYIIFCAAHWNGINKDTNILDNNIITITNLLNSISTPLKKLIFISSSAVYQNDLQNDDVPINKYPDSSYGTSKLLSEQLVEQYSKFKDFKFTIYRPFHIVSPEENFEWGKSHVCTDFCHKIISKGELIDIDTLDNIRKIGFMCVIDFAKIVVENLPNINTDNEIINIGTHERHSLKELAIEIINDAIEFKLVNRVPITNMEKSSDSKFDQRFKKLDTLCKNIDNTSFSDCIKYFIKYKYLKS